jgi:hypothetical protein
MAEISKQALLVDNNQSFPDNNSGTITPVDLRSFNVDLIDSTVNQAVYTTNSGSWNNTISQLNAFTASQQPSFNALNSFTASQLVINTGVNSFTQSATGRLNNLESTTASLNTFSSSINQIIVNGVSIGTSTRFFFNGFVSASIVPNVDGAIASITVLSDPSLTPTASFNSYTASTAATQSIFSASVATSISQSSNAFNTFSASQNSFNLSATASLVELLNLSSSLSGGYATQGELDQSASVLQANINQKLFTSSFNDYTQSTAASQSLFSASVATSFSQSYSIINNNSSSTSVSISSLSSSIAITNDAQTSIINTLSSFTGSYATTGSNNFIGNQSITGSLTITGSTYGNVISTSISTQTASIDLSSANYFTLTLSGSTNINVINPKPGNTAILRITTSATSSVTFSSNVLQPTGSIYSPTTGDNNIDILTLTAFDTGSVYVIAATQFK